MDTHSLILAYDKTYEFGFPLILVVGREPNNGSLSDGSTGHYDFVQYGRCAFWNVGFSLLGRLQNKTCRDIKREFIQHKSSPMLFADAFPQGILNSKLHKSAIRKQQLKLAHEQVESIFKHVDLLKRVKLVILV